MDSAQAALLGGAGDHRATVVTGDAPERVTRSLRAGDAPSLLRLVTAVEAADATGEHEYLADVEHQLADPDVDLASDTLAVLDGAGLVVACGTVRPVHDDELVLTGCVDPAARRRGHGRALVGWAGAQAVARGRTVVSAEARDGLPGVAELFTDARLVPVRHTLVMSRDLADLSTAPTTSATPDRGPGGASQVTTSTAGDDRGGLGTDGLRELYRSAFATHRGYQEPSPQRWAQWYAGSPNQLPGLALVAREGGTDGRPVGFALGYHWAADTAVTGVRDAWLGQLGVVPDARRRGTASLLLAGFLARAAALGFDTAGLSVDTANADDASALYRRHGFVTTTSFTTYRGPVGPGGRWARAGAEDTG